jgi:TPR repeat protein
LAILPYEKLIKMTARILSILVLLVTACAGQDAQVSATAKNPEVLYKNGRELLNKGLCASDKYRAGISKNLTRTGPAQSDFKPNADALEGFKLISEAHSLGYPDASFVYAKCMESGILIEENFLAGIELHRKLAKAGYVPSQVHLGYELMYGRLAKDRFLFKSSGTRVSADVEAFSWYLKAAENGDPSSQNSVAVCYKNAVGTERDLAASLKWAKLSAFAGCYAGQTTLGIHYINGDAVPQDLDVANAWLKIASEDPDGGLVSMYINKIAPYVDKKRSAEIEALIRSDLKKVTTSPSVQNGATK